MNFDETSALIIASFVGASAALVATFVTLEADVPNEKADVLHATYDRITVAGPEIVGVRLTQAAYAHGLAVALPTKVALARPTGVEPADATIIVRRPDRPAAVVIDPPIGSVIHNNR